MDVVVDVVTMGVIASRLDGIVREMTGAILRTARSMTMAARDFSCCLISAEHEMLACPEGFLAHVSGVGPSAADMAALHPEFAEGDVFLHNDPYLGGGHAADHQILLPVFHEGEHVMTVGVKAHQVDIGNSQPTTYMYEAKDVYEEGALIFPCVRVQQNHEDVADIIRMCQRRIRDFETWYGDFVAQVGAARLGERRVKELCSKYGADTIRAFVREYFDYSERVTAAMIRRLPAGRISGSISHDPYAGAPDGIELNVTIDVEPEAGRVVVDLTDNPDCLANGLNLTESISRNAGIAGVLTVLGSMEGASLLSPNAGSFRCIDVVLRENCCVGIPRHPASCSIATNDLSDRTIGMVVNTFAQLGSGIGLAEPSPPGGGGGQGVISGWDRARNAKYFVQVILGFGGGPASSLSDGWLTFATAGGAGLAVINSVENVEQKLPIVVWDRRFQRDSEGAGRRRGAPGLGTVRGPRLDPATISYKTGVHIPARGVVGGGSAGPSDFAIVDADGHWDHPSSGRVQWRELQPGETIFERGGGGGGYGDPLERDPELVLQDVVDLWISRGRAQAVYGVVLEGDEERWETLRVSAAATAAERGRLAAMAERVDHREPYGDRAWWTERRADMNASAS